MSKFTAIIILLFISLLFIANLTMADEKATPVRFIVLGDRTGSHQGTVFADLVKEAVRLRPDFVTNVGDMIEGYTDDSARIISEWKEYDSIVSVIDAPYYRTVGNHDILDSTDEYWYRKIVGEPYYSVDYKNIHLVYIDNARWDSSVVFFTAPEAMKQIAWLTEDLKQNQNAEKTIVFMHKPYWYYTLSNNLPDPLHDLFKIYGVDAVFTGHFHDYFVGEYDGVKYTSLGSSGGGTETAPNGLHYHYAWVTVGDEIDIAPIKFESVLAWDVITVDEIKVYGPLSRLGLQFTKTADVADDLSVTDAPVMLTVDNTESAYPVKSEVKWDMPDGWTLSPEITEVEIPAGEKKDFSLQATCSGQVFPMPKAKVTFQYAEDKYVDAKATMFANRHANCQPAKDIKIDGDLSDPAWMEGQEVLFNWDGSEMKCEPVRFYYAYDENNLYLSAYCKESEPDSIMANTKEHDGAVYGDDCLGYFITPKMGLDTLYQIYFNSKGIVYDAKYWIKSDSYLSGTKDWNGEYEVKTKKQPDGWTMEARIPTQQFGVSLKQGDKMKINFRRKQPRLGNAEWQLPLEWDPDTYGTLEMK